MKRFNLYYTIFLVFVLQVPIGSNLVCFSKKSLESIEVNLKFFQEYGSDHLSIYYFVGSIIGPILVTLLLDNVGRKLTLQVFTAIFSIGWLIKVYSNDLVTLYIGRVIIGIADIPTMYLSLLYLVEVTEVKLRNVITCMSSVFILLGINLTYWIDDSDMKQLEWATFGLLAVFLVGSLRFKESPYYYVPQGRYGEARESLIWFRGKMTRSELELELIAIKNLVSDTTSKNVFQQIGMMFTKSPYKKMLILNTSLVLFAQLAGFIPVTVDLDVVLIDIGAREHLTQLTTAIGILSLLTALIASLLSKWISNKVLIFSSALSTGIFSMLMAIFFGLKHAHDLESSTWLSVLLFIGRNMSICGGLWYFPWVLATESLPPFKAAVSGVLLLIASLGTTVDSLFYSTYLAARPHIPFTASSLVALFIVLPIVGIWAPDTRGLSLDRIYLLFMTSTPTLISDQDDAVPMQPMKRTPIINVHPPSES